MTANLNVTVNQKYVFEYTEGYYRNDTCCLDFSCQNSNSFFKTFEMEGFYTGSFVFRVRYNKENFPQIKDFFSKLGIEAKIYYSCTCIQKPVDLQKLFTAMGNLYEIPEDKRQLIEIALKTCNWKNVPDLKNLAKDNKKKDEHIHIMEPLYIYYHGFSPYREYNKY